MRSIINIRIENDKLILFKFQNQDIYNYEQLFTEMLMNDFKCQILCGNEFEELKLSSDGNNIVFPELDKLREINIL